jgi:hypothetical protein
MVGDFCDLVVERDYVEWLCGSEDLSVRFCEWKNMMEFFLESQRSSRITIKGPA